MKIRTGFVSNSSSSSFICDTKMPIEKVRKILIGLYDLYKIINASKPKKEQDPDFPKKFLGMFQEPFIVKSVNDEYVNSIWEWKEGYDQQEGERQSLPEPMKIALDCLQENPFRNIKTKKDLIGKLIINSASDNSIPYPFFETIKEIFNGVRVHLG